jgi:alpha-tubulin suppressor-like RCC1 family protein
MYHLKTNPLHSCLLCVALMLAPNAGAQAIMQIASADAVSFFVKSDGSLWRGDFAHALAKRNERMQRLRDELKQHPRSTQAFEQMREEGKHITSKNFEPVDLIVSNGVTSVAINGQSDTFFIKNDGSLWAMGNNEGGFLGDGTSETPAHPIQIVPSGVVAVACGEAFTLLLKDDGSVWGFGWNGDGPLGDGTESTSIMRPKQFINGGVAAIAAGSSHSLFIMRDGSLWGTGNNTFGQLGLGTNVNHVLKPVEIVASNVVSVAAAHGHTLFIKRDGSLWTMGLNDWGQIGDCSIDWRYHPEQIVSNNVVAVAAGYSGSLFLKKDGSLWGMGINWGSDYGEGIEFQSHCPTQIFAANHSALVAGYYYNAQLKTCASVWAGKFNSNPPIVGSAASKAELPSSVASLPGYNLITIEQLKDGNVRLTYSGNAGANYALERSSNLANPTWVALLTNTAPSGGVLVITNTPDMSMNNFWRIRSVP